ncbi:MAG: peptidoglycan DD-metalloendopeptidase family protein [Pseudomonadales bacterium]|nr:peptidoglycan DD-metalloendopeptidase family protein [Pseudomonadales bacterium]
MPLSHFLLPLLLLAVFTGKLPANAQEPAQEPTQELAPEARIEAVDTAIAQIEAWLGEAAANRSGLEQDLRSNNLRRRSLDTEIEQTRQDLTTQQQEITTLDTRIAALQQRLATQQALVTDAIQASYLLGREAPLKLLLNQQDPARSARQLQYYRYFNTARLAQIGEFQQTLESLAAAQLELDQELQTLAEREHQLQLQLDELAANRLERTRLLAALTEEMASRSGELEQLQADRAHLEQLIAEINQALLDIPAPEQLMPFAQARGQLPWPLPGQLLNQFGASYSDGNLQRQGIIIEAPAGEPVRAIHPGRVVFADWLRGSGFLVILDHGDNFLSLYAHNQQLQKQAGDWANRGEQIAQAGTDAGLGRPGIYFEIRHNGVAQNPVSWSVQR